LERHAAQSSNWLEEAEQSEEWLRLKEEKEIIVVPHINNTEAHDTIQSSGRFRVFATKK
jgi:hypothetical protein